MNIDKTTLRLTDDQYYQEVFKKDLVVIHHTVGGSAKSSVEYWQSTPDHVGVAYVIERNGTVYEVFDPKYWAYHLGLKSSVNLQLNRSSIGIELASEGALRSGAELNSILGVSKFDSNFLYAFDIDTPPFAHAKKLYNKSVDMDKYIDLGAVWRGYRYFDAYDPLQQDALFELIKLLCEQFVIPKKLLSGDRTRFDLFSVVGFAGIVGHINVRSDKTDPHKMFPWNKLEEFLA